MHLAWINDWACVQGGAEVYLLRTARELRRRFAVRSTLLYDPVSRIDSEFAESFALFPAASLRAQLEELKPDLVVLNRLPRSRQFPSSAFPTVGILHDHSLFCLRESKFTTLKGESCTRVTGGHCYSCLGFVARGSDRRWSVRHLGHLGRMREVFRACRRVVVPSSYLKDHACQHGFGAEQIAVLPLYCSARHAAPAPDLQRLLFVGNLVRGKGLDLLLRALEKVSSRWHLQVAGQGPSLARYVGSVRRRGWSDRVEFLGQQTCQQLERLYTESLVVVFPTRMETFGLVGIEAMSYGRAVIAFDVGGVGEWLSDEWGWRVPPGAVDRFGECLEEALSDPQATLRKGERGRQEHARRFLPEPHLDGLYQLLQSCLSHR